MYKLWLKLLTVDYIKVYVEKFDSEHYAKEKVILISHLLTDLHHEVASLFSLIKFQIEPFCAWYLHGRKQESREYMSTPLPPSPW